MIIVHGLNLDPWEILEILYHELPETGFEAHTPFSQGFGSPGLDLRILGVLYAYNIKNISCTRVVNAVDTEADTDACPVDGREATVIYDRDK